MSLSALPSSGRPVRSGRWGVFLVVDGQPRVRAAGVELYHIGEQQAYSHYIVLLLSGGHFECKEHHCSCLVVRVREV